MNPRDVMNSRSGFAARACDGALSWPVVEVATVSELVRAAQTDHTWIRVRGGVKTADGWSRVVYRLPERLTLAPSVVIQGFGFPKIEGYGLRITKPNAILADFEISDVEKDAIEVTSGGANVFATYLKISRWGDGAFDIVRAPSGASDDYLNVTQKKLLIEKGKKVCLIGKHDDDKHDRRYRVSIEGNLYRNVGFRAPFRARHALVKVNATYVDGFSGTAACHVGENARAELRKAAFYGGQKDAKAVTVGGGALRVKQSPTVDQENVNAHLVQ